MPGVPVGDGGEDLGLQAEGAVQGDHRQCGQGARGEVLNRAAALAAALFALVALGGTARALTVPDHPTGRVNDFAGALSSDARARLEAELKSYESGTRQMAVAIFRSLESESEDQFTIDLAIKWKIGGKKNQDGVLMTVFLEERRMRIEVGYGLEDRLTDAMCARIIREIIGPKFRAGDVAGGLSAGFAELNRIASGGQPTLPPVRAHGGDAGTGIGGGLVLFLIIVVVLIVVARRRGGGGGGFTGGGGGWILGAALGSLGGGGGGGGGSDDGGGFSGGGGDFGGGGASGSW